MECPKCGWSDVRGSNRAGFWDHLAGFLLLTPVRCRKCRLRYYRLWFMVDPAGAKLSSIIETREEAPTPKAQPSVLLLDEDAALRKLLSRVLAREGYNVREASDRSEAMLELRSGAIDIVIVNLSDQNRPLLVRDLRIAHPPLMIVALSGAGDAEEFPANAPGGNLLILPRLTRAHAVIQELNAMIAASRHSHTSDAPSSLRHSNEVQDSMNRLRPPSELAKPARPSASRVSRSSSTAASSDVFAMKRAPFASRRPTMIPVSRPFFE